MTSLIEPTVVYHRSLGARTMHAVDANSAVSNTPREWSRVPWTDAVVEEVEAKINRNEEMNRVPIVGALEQEGL
jgi:hypothetical protein